MPIALLLAAVGLLAVVALVGWSVVAGRLRESRERWAALEHDQLRRLENELDSLTDLLNQLPQLTRTLHGRPRPRDLPEAILQLLLHVFEPRAALVLLRRKRQIGSETLSDQSLVVAAVGPAGRTVELGTTVAIDEGELGFVATAQRAITRRDLEAENGMAQRHIWRGNLPGFETDLAAPMVFDGETLGVLALTRPLRHSLHQKLVLRLFAQLAAYALHDAQTYSEVRHAAAIDPLTGTFNKRVLMFRLGELLYEAGRLRHPLSVFLFDLDHFKHYNDAHGHMAGDEVLRQLAQLIKENVRAEDIVGRFGGEEFLLILRNRTADQALATAENLRRLIAHFDFRHRETQPLGALTISGGVASLPGDGRDSATLLRAADAALYRAKNLGRNRIELASETYLRAANPVTT
jgi:diguanylate cyclase (GGDEF)-like protein